MLVGLFLLAIAVTLYILNAMGLDSIAQRRGLRKPWLAWIPICNSWMLGSISDQYQLSVKGKKTSRRKILLGLRITLILAAILTVIVTVVAFFYTVTHWRFGEEYSIAQPGNPENEMLFAKLTIVVMGMVLLNCLIWLVYKAFACMAQYDLYRSCMPDNAAVFLTLSIIFGFLAGIFIFTCRDHDSGLAVSQQPEQENNI